jgi:hypothetical protein
MSLNAGGGAAAVIACCFSTLCGLRLANLPWVMLYWRAYPPLIVPHLHLHPPTHTSDPALRCTVDNVLQGE